VFNKALAGNGTGFDLTIGAAAAAAGAVHGCNILL
jgi:hypothetical protein